MTIGGLNRTLEELKHDIADTVRNRRNSLNRTLEELKLSWIMDINMCSGS